MLHGRVSGKYIIPTSHLLTCVVIMCMHSPRRERHASRLEELWQGGTVRFGANKPPCTTRLKEDLRHLESLMTRFGISSEEQYGGYLCPGVYISGRSECGNITQVRSIECQTAR